MPIGSPASRKLLLSMVVLVVALDAVAIGTYFAFGLSQRPNQVQMAFTVIWVMITLAIVFVYLHRIRQLRDAAVRRERQLRGR
jgi:hypothetical protein